MHWAATLCPGHLVVRSPYERSRIYVKSYFKGDENGLHYDTNDVTGILTLQTAEEGGGFVFHKHGKTHRIKPEAGSVLLFDRSLLHGGEVVRRGMKQIAIFNYYVAELGVPASRPEGVDRLIFGDDDK